ncbi:MAG TPA: Hsp33 family molecular chaperone HslO [Thiolinea sp.]|nr:Hsp33 family molecular chaperone HslO [Thiolinea sp.]
MMQKDSLHRFLLDQLDIRGEWVHLDEVWQQLQSRADYPPPVCEVLGQALAAVVLLSATVKHRGSLILQIRGDGPVHLLVVQATPEGTVRGLARWSRVPEQQDLAGIFGQGHIAITMEAASADQERYQGIIALEGGNLAQALEGYFARSEQLPTRLHLFSDAQVAAGVLLQRLPGTRPPAAGPVALDEDWQRCSLLLETLSEQELRELDAASLVFRLFHEDEPRLFEGRSVRFHCGCSLQKVSDMVRSLGEDEAQSILTEQGMIEVTCEFCNCQYRLDPVDVAGLFTRVPVEPGSRTIH